MRMSCGGAVMAKSRSLGEKAALYWPAIGKDNTSVAVATSHKRRLFPVAAGSSPTLIRLYLELFEANKPPSGENASGQGCPSRTGKVNSQAPLARSSNRISPQPTDPPSTWRIQP